MCLESSEEVAWCDLSQVCPTGPLGLRLSGSALMVEAEAQEHSGDTRPEGLSSELVLLGKTSHN